MAATTTKNSSVGAVRTFLVATRSTARGHRSHTRMTSSTSSTRSRCLLTWRAINSNRGSELARITRRDGLVLLTTQGNAYRSELEADELALFHSGALVARREKASGLNLCFVYHPPTAIQRLATSASLECERSLDARVVRLDLHALRKRPPMDR